MFKDSDVIIIGLEILKTIRKILFRKVNLSFVN
jgi:hypothetical protein